MRLLGFCQGLEPFRQFVEAFLARALRHPRVHFRVFVSFPLDGRLQVFLRAAERHPGGGIADFFKKVQMTEGVPGLGL
jgi:hypothetical protein